MMKIWPSSVAGGLDLRHVRIMVQYLLQTCAVNGSCLRSPVQPHRLSHILFKFIQYMYVHVQYVNDGDAVEMHASASDSTHVLDLVRALFPRSGLR